MKLRIMICFSFLVWCVGAGFALASSGVKGIADSFATSGDFSDSGSAITAAVEGGSSASITALKLQWKQRSIGGGYSKPGMAVDSSGNLHVVFWKLAYPKNPLIHAWSDGKRWRSETVDFHNVYSSSVAIDQNGGIHIAYTSYNPEEPNAVYTLKYAYNDGSGWKTEVVEPGGLASSIVVDPDNTPHIVHITSSASEVRHVTRSGSGWSSEVVGTGGSSLAGTSLVQRNGHLYATFSASNTTLATNESGVWTTSTIDKGRDNSLAFDATGIPHVVYNKETSPGGVWHAWYSDGIWHKEALAAQGTLFGEAVPAGLSISGEYPVLTADSSGRLHLAFGLVLFNDKGAAQALCYALFQGGEWIYADVVTKSLPGIRNAIVVTPDGLPQIAGMRNYNSGIVVAGLKGQKLSLTVTPKEHGTVQLSSPSKSCGAKCSESYFPGSLVTLTALPMAGKSFVDWRGACSGSDPVCTVTMDRVRSVTARFSK